MRTISDELYARIVKQLAQNEAVAVFQQLLLSPKTDETGELKTATETETNTGGKK